MDGVVRVTCGKRVSKKEVSRFVMESRDFILKRTQEVDALRAKYPLKHFVDQEEHLFLGERVPLQLIWSWRARVKVKWTAGRLEVVAPLQSTRLERSKAMQSFFRKEARTLLADRLAYYSEVMGLVPTALSIRGQRSRWGSCSGRAEISLNWKLLAAPLWAIDYVVVHELAHIQHMNHSAEFWALVSRYIPEWKVARKWLKVHEFEISVQFQGKS